MDEIMNWHTHKWVILGWTLVIVGAQVGQAATGTWEKLVLTEDKLCR